MNRRKFIARTGGALAAASGLGMLGPSMLPAAGPEKLLAKPAGRREAKVVIARDPKVWRGETLDAERVRELMFKALRTLSGKKTDAEAWRTYYGAGDVVGVKMNCASGKGMSNGFEATGAMAEGLRAAGVKEENIIFWDNMRMLLMRAGYRVRNSGGGIRYTATDAPGIGYDDDITIAGEVGSRLSRIVSTMCNSLLNAPVLKDHGLCGVTLSMKNYFGAINNPNKLHDNNCDPYAADLNTIPALRDKTKLIVCDGLMAQYEGGPGYKAEFLWKFSGFLASTDPVALDAVGAKIIEEKRKEKGLPSLAKAGRAPNYIRSAAHPSRALGTADLKKIKIIEI